jgi:uncharacterized protein (TIRG00374 family)
MKRYISYGLSTIVLLAALWYLMQGITSEEWTLIGQDFGKLHWTYVIIGLAISMISHVARAERYRTILRPIHPAARFVSSFNAVMIGYAFNTVLPRAGEVVRPVVFAKREGIGTEQAIGAVLIERILDVVSIMIALFFVMAAAGDTVARIFSFYSASAAGSAALDTGAIVNNLVVVLAVLLGLVGVLVFTRIGQLFAESFIGRIHKPTGTAIAGVINRISSGLSVIKEPRLYARLTIETTVVWAAYCFVSLFIIKAMPYEFANSVTLSQASIILVVVGLAVTIAPTPGALGVYQIAAQAALVTVCGATMTQGLVFGMISWFVNYGLVLVGGGICWVIESRRKPTTTLNSSTS